MFKPRKLFYLRVKDGEVTCTVDFDEGYTCGAWEDFPADSPLTIRALQLAHERRLSPVKGRIYFGEDAELSREFNQVKTAEATASREDPKAPRRNDNETLTQAVETSACPQVEHPSLVAYVKTGPNTSWPVLVDDPDGSLEWLCRYAQGALTETDFMTIASVLGAYDMLVHVPSAAGNLPRIRKALRT